MNNWQTPVVLLALCVAMRASPGHANETGGLSNPLAPGEPDQGTLVHTGDDPALNDISAELSGARLREDLMLNGVAVELGSLARTSAEAVLAIAPLAPGDEAQPSEGMLAADMPGDPDRLAQYAFNAAFDAAFGVKPVMRDDTLHFGGDAAADGAAIDLDVLALASANADLVTLPIAMSDTAGPGEAMLASAVPLDLGALPQSAAGAVIEVGPIALNLAEIGADDVAAAAPLNLSAFSHAVADPDLEVGPIALDDTSGSGEAMVGADAPLDLSAFWQLVTDTRLEVGPIARNETTESGDASDAPATKAALDLGAFSQVPADGLAASAALDLGAFSQVPADGLAVSAALDLDALARAGADAKLGTGAIAAEAAVADGEAKAAAGRPLDLSVFARASAVADIERAPIALNLAEVGADDVAAAAPLDPSAFTRSGLDVSLAASEPLARDDAAQADHEAAAPATRGSAGDIERLPAASAAAPDALAVQAEDDAAASASRPPLDEKSAELADAAKTIGDEAAGVANVASDSSSAIGDEAIFGNAAVERVADAELSEQRAGFTFQGLDIRLGGEVRSYIGNELVIQTNFTWTDAQQTEIQRMISTQLTPATVAGLQSGLISGNGLNLRAGDDVFLGNNGQTAFIQRTEGTLQNVIVNAASNVEFRQEIEAQLDISNFAPFSNSVLSERITSALSTALSALGQGLR